MIDIINREDDVKTYTRGNHTDSTLIDRFESNQIWSVVTHASKQK